MNEDQVQVKIPIFEGPLDLLLHLIRKNEVDIYDIPISTITAQYLDYLELMKTLNIEVAGEFLVMAATLIHIKSRLLLPARPGDEDMEDPREELTRPLLEYIRFKEAAGRLQERWWLERDVFVRGKHDEIDPVEQEQPLFNLGLFELIDAFQQLMRNLSLRRDHVVRFKQASLSDRISTLMDRFRQEGDLLFTELFAEDLTRAELIVTFLAVLELARMGFIYVYQETAFGPIRLSSRPEAFAVEDEDDV